MDLKKSLGKAVQFYWSTRLRQGESQGGSAGAKDRGNRSAVTGGAQADGFIQLIRDILVECGLPEVSIEAKATTLPGYFRATKDWDLIVVSEGMLIASIEFKAQAGPSFGNNFNNRVEEAIGSATDLWTAFREGAFSISERPWLGYFMMLEERSESLRPVKLLSPHFPVFEEFNETSYARRYEIFCERLIRERLYDSACFIMSSKEDGLRGKYTEPNLDLCFRNFAESLMGKAIAFAHTRK